jgi:hypothetical protein
MKFGEGRMMDCEVIVMMDCWNGKEEMEGSSKELLYIIGSRARAVLFSSCTYPEVPHETTRKANE